MYLRLALSSGFSLGIIPHWWNHRYQTRLGHQLLKVKGEKVHTGERHTRVEKKMSLTLCKCLLHQRTTIHGLPCRLAAFKWLLSTKAISIHKCICSCILHVSTNHRASIWGRAHTITVELKHSYSLEGNMDDLSSHLTCKSMVMLVCCQLGKNMCTVINNYK